MTVPGGPQNQDPQRSGPRRGDQRGYRQRRQQPGGYLQPPPAPYAAAVQARPGVVNAAAVLAFVDGGLSLTSAFITLALGNFVPISGLGFLRVLALLLIVVSAALIWGGVRALNGTDARILAVAAVCVILLKIISLVVHFRPLVLLSFVLPGLVLYFLLSPQAKRWFDARGGTHF